jgi:hypothetical protein
MLKAKARVYTLGEAVGMTRYTVVDPQVLKDAIKSDKVPLLSSFENFNDSDKVIGHAELSVDGNSLYATLTFNDANADIYSEAFTAGYEPKTGFYAAGVGSSKDGVVSSMEIRSIVLNETCLGGKLDDIWED